MPFLQDDDEFSFDQPPASGASVMGGTAQPAMPDAPSFASSLPSQPQASAPPTFSFASGGAAVDGQPGGGEMPSFETQPMGADVAAPGSPGGPSSAPQAPTPTPAAAPSGGTDHTQLLTQLRSATDPAQKAILQDRLGRSLYTSLQTAGHDVKWQGDRLIVDGRPYVLGDGNLPGEGSPTPGPAPDQPMPGAAAAPDYTTRGAFADRMGAWSGDSEKWQEPWDQKSERYQILSVLSHFDPRKGITPEVIDALNRANIRGAKFSGSGQNLSVDNAGGWERFGGGGTSDIVKGLKSGNGEWLPWSDPALEGQSDGPAPIAPPPGTDPRRAYLPPINDPTQGAPAPGAPAPAGWKPGEEPGYVPGEVGLDDIPSFSYEDLLRDMEMQPVGTLDTGYQAGRVSNDPANFGRVEDDYAAGAVTNDPLEEYNFEGFGDLGELGAGRTDAQTEDLVSQILENPESYPPHIVEMLKARSKDELAEMQLADDQDLTSLGFANGIQDSNWLASEKLAAQGRRDQALVQSNRDIDLEAAARNTEDRRAAAGVGLSYVDSKDSRNRGNRSQRFNEATAAEGFEQDEVTSSNRASQFRREGEVANEGLRGDAAERRMRGQSSNVATRQAEASYEREGELANERLRGEASDRNLTAAQQNIDNQFRSAAEKRAAVGLASDQALKAAALKGDRIALREQLAQKAAELGIAKDRVMGDYLLGLMDDATRKYGIDVGASIDRAKIAQQSEQWQEELAYKLAALAQNDRQFGAAHGLDFARYAKDVDDEQYRRFADSLSYED